MSKLLTGMGTAIVRGSMDQYREFVQAKYAEVGRGAVWMNMARIGSNFISYMPLDSLRAACRSPRTLKDMHDLNIPVDDLLEKMESYDPNKSLVVVILPDQALLDRFGIAGKSSQDNPEKLPVLVGEYDFLQINLN